METETALPSSSSLIVSISPTAMSTAAAVRGTALHRLAGDHTLLEGYAQFMQQEVVRAVRCGFWRSGSLPIRRFLIRL